MHNDFINMRQSHHRDTHSYLRRYYSRSLADKFWNEHRFTNKPFVDPHSYAQRYGVSKNAAWFKHRSRDSWKKYGKFAGFVAGAGALGYGAYRFLKGKPSEPTGDPKSHVMHFRSADPKSLISNVIASDPHSELSKSTFSLRSDDPTDNSRSLQSLPMSPRRMTSDRFDGPGTERALKRRCTVRPPSPSPSSDSLAGNNAGKADFTSAFDPLAPENVFVLRQKSMLNHVRV